MEPLMASFLVASLCFSQLYSYFCSWGEHSTVSKQSASAMMRAKSSSHPNTNRNPNHHGWIHPNRNPNFQICVKYNLNG